MGNQDNWSDIKIGKGWHILIIDDEVPVRQSLAQYLRWDGYQVSLARSGHEALSMLLTQTQPDLIVLDIVLSELGGFSLAYEIRKRTDVPIMVLSSITDVSTKVEALVEFAQDYVTKPFHEEEVGTRIRRILAMRLQGRTHRFHTGSRNGNCYRLSRHALRTGAATSPYGHRCHRSNR